MKNIILCSILALSFGLSIGFFGIATPIYIIQHEKKPAQCLVKDMKIEESTCEDVCTMNNNVRTCTYTDCWYPTWFVIIQADTLSNDMEDWISSSKDYYDVDKAEKAGNEKVIGETYNCWYLMKGDEAVATWKEPNYTVAIVLFSLGGVFFLPVIAIAIWFLTVSIRTV